MLGEKNAAKIVEALGRARTMPLNRWLIALGVPDIGEQTAYDIARFHDDFEGIARSTLLQRTVELARLSERILQNSPLTQANKQKPEEEREAMRPVWQSLIAEADRKGRQLIETGFAQPAKGNKNPREAVTPVGPVAAAKSAWRPAMAASRSSNAPWAS